MSNISYTIKLPSFEFFKNDDVVIPFEFYDAETNEGIDLRSFDVRVYLFPYGRYDMPVLFDNTPYKLCSISQTEPHKCILHLTSIETGRMEVSKYVYQPSIVIDKSQSRNYIRGEGEILFRSSYDYDTWS